MTTNEERREAAKRKLEERLEAERQQQHRRRTMLGSLAGVVVVALVATGGFFIYRAWDDSRRADCTYNEAQSPFDELPDELPPTVPAEQRAQMQELLTFYQAGAKKQRTAPRPETKPFKEGTVDVDFATSVGDVPTTLNRADGACNVNGVVALAQAGYYDDVPCHAMTVTEDGGVVLCGDPTGTAGTSSGWIGGDPGWTMPDEVPTGLKTTGEANPMDPSEQMVTYPRGTVALFNVNAPDNPMTGQEGTANTATGTLYFFLKDTPLLPQFTVVGTVDEAGLATLDKIRDGGITPGPGAGAPKPGEPVQVGAPKTPVIVDKVTVRED